MTADAPHLVRNIQVDQYDGGGVLIIQVYNAFPARYAIYRTMAGVGIQYADDPDLAIAQRAKVAPLSPLRGQINGWVNQWRDLGVEAPIPGGVGKARLWISRVRSSLLDKHKAGARERAERYDLRVAGAIGMVLQDVSTVEGVELLLRQIHSDIISERIGIARLKYVKLAVILALLSIFCVGLLASNVLISFGPAMEAVWTALVGGSLGAFFSIAIGLKSREVPIDHQNRDNTADVVLRTMIGIIAGGMLYCLFASGFLKVANIEPKLLDPRLPDYSGSLVFLIGFVAGFLERLVPDLLDKSNFGLAHRDSPRPRTGPAVARADDEASRSPQGDEGEIGQAFHGAA